MRSIACTCCRTLNLGAKTPLDVAVTHTQHVLPPDGNIHTNILINENGRVAAIYIYIGRGIIDYIPLHSSVVSDLRLSENSVLSLLSYWQHKLVKHTEPCNYFGSNQSISK